MASIIIIKLLLFIARVLVHSDIVKDIPQAMRLQHEYYDVLRDAELELQELED